MRTSAKPIVFVLCAALLLSGVISSSVSAAETGLQTSASTGFHLDWWDSPNDDKGVQYYIPLKIETRYKAFSIGLLTGQAYTMCNPSEGDKRSISHILDTKLNLAYEVIGTMPVDILFGLDLNLPTGKTNLKDKDLCVIMDPDLVSITSLGEGFNINPTIALAKEWHEWIFGVGVGYVFRGEYDYCKSLHDYDPGNIFTVTSRIQYTPSVNWSFRFFMNFSKYAKDEVDDEDYYREGDFLQLGIGGKYTRDRFDIECVLQSILRAKSKFATDENNLEKENDNSHGDEWLAKINGHYYMDERTILNSSLDLMLITDNDYPKSSRYYWGERKKASLSVGITRVLASHLTGALGLSGFYMSDDETWYHPDSDQCYRGFSLEVKLISNF